MTTQATYAAPTPTPYVFWLAAWHNLPIPPGEPRCCRITSAALEIDLTPTERLSIPLNNILNCERHIAHDDVVGLYLYARLTVVAAEAATGYPVTEEIFLSALDPISQNWDWQETINLITLLNELRQHNTPTLHANPYYRALERRSRSDDFTLFASSWDALLPPAHYEQHPLIQEIRRQSTRTIGLPLLFILLCIIIAALLWWLNASHWLILNSALGLASFALASFWPAESHQRCQQMICPHTSNQLLQ